MCHSENGGLRFLTLNYLKKYGPRADMSLSTKHKDEKFTVRVSCWLSDASPRFCLCFYKTGFKQRGPIGY